MEHVVSSTPQPTASVKASVGLREVGFLVPPPLFLAGWVNLLLLHGIDLHQPVLLTVQFGVTTVVFIKNSSCPHGSSGRDSLALLRFLGFNMIYFIFFDDDDIMCSNPGYREIVELENPATGRAWTPLEFLLNAFETGAAPVSSSSRVEDRGGVALWPQGLFIQPMIDAGAS